MNVTRLFAGSKVRRNFLNVKDCLSLFLHTRVMRTNVTHLHRLVTMHENVLVDMQRRYIDFFRIQDTEVSCKVFSFFFFHKHCVVRIAISLKKWRKL